MRIVAGKHKGKRLATPKDRRVRPTPDRVREALFSILVQRLSGGRPELPPETRVLDLFAGTGALGLEALSRGAAHATFMDTDRDSVALIDRNVRGLGEEKRTTVVKRDATRPGPADGDYNLVFLDPPYGENLAPATLTALKDDGWLAEDAVIAVELGKKTAFDPPGGFAVTADRVYGNTRILILKTTD